MGACLPGAAAAILASRCATDTSAVGPSNVCVVGRAVLGRGVGEGGDFKHTAARPGISRGVSVTRGEECARHPGLPYSAVIGNAAREYGRQELTKYTDNRGEVGKADKGTQEQATRPFVDLSPARSPFRCWPFEIVAKRQTLAPCPKLDAVKCAASLK